MVSLYVRLTQAEVIVLSIIVVDSYRKYLQKNVISERHVGIYDSAGSR